jgi:WD40 repeat protein
MRRRHGFGWERLCDLDAHSGPVLDLALSPDGALLASAGQDGTVALARLLAKDCAPQAPLTGHRTAVNSVRFAPDGASLVSAGQDTSALVWSRDGRPLARLTGHRERVSLAEFSPDGHWVLTGSRDGDLRLWPAPTAPVGTLDGAWLTLGAGQRGVTSAAFTPGGRGLIAGYWGNAAVLWRLWSATTPAPTLVATWGPQRAGLALIQEADRFRRENRLDLRPSGPGEGP